MVLQDICSYCRARKIRCDQAKPHCGQCIEAIYACTYDYGAHTSRKSALAKGSACLSCRRDKKKCDGVKPKCSTCRKSPNDLECIYQPGKKRKKKSDIPQEIPAPSSGTSCSAPIGSGDNGTVSIRSPQPFVTANVTSDISWSFYDGVVHPDLSQAGCNTNALVVSSTSHRMGSPPQPEFGPEMIYATTQGAFERSFGIFDTSVPVYTIDADPQAFVLSSISVHDRKMLFRMIFVSLRTMHGSYIPFAKLQAIIIGDLSGAFVHPFFTRFAEVSGCHFYQYNRSDFSLLQHQGELLRATYETLDTMRPEDDPLAYAQAQIYMSMAVMNTGNIKVAMNHLRKGANTIRTFDIRFVPQGVGINENTIQEIGGYSEEAHERAVFLSKILHFEAYLSLYVMGLPGIQSFSADRDMTKVSHIATQRVQASIKDLCDDLEHQFRNELPIAYPVLCEICPLILRAKTMILMKDVRRHMALVNQQAFGAGWLRQTETLIIRLQQHLVVVLKLVDKFVETREHDSTVSLRSHSIITLTGLSELYRLLVRHPLSTPAVAKEAQRRCADILKMIANITERMLKEDWKQMANFVRDNYGDPITAFSPSEPSMMVTLTSTGGFAGTPLPVPSRTFLENLENFNDQAKRFTEGDERMVGIPFEVIPKLFRTKFAEGSQCIRPDLRSRYPPQDHVPNAG